MSSEGTNPLPGQQHWKVERGREVGKNRKNDYALPRKEPMRMILLFRLIRKKECNHVAYAGGKARAE